MSLKMIIGPMFSGKTTSLIEIIKQNKCMNSLSINYLKNNRYGTNENITHTGIPIETTYKVITENLNDIILSEEFLYYKNSELIIIDECQFYSDIYSFVINAIENDNKHVVCAGLNGDSNKNLFGNLFELIPHVDEIKFLKTKCECGNDAIFSKRIVSTQEQILIGERDLYKAVCRKCYKSNL